MATRGALSEIKQHLDASVGKRIKLRANRGRKKIIERHGILEQTYPNIFVIKLDEKTNSVRRLSFSYADVLTETVQLTIYKDQDQKEKEQIV